MTDESTDFGPYTEEHIALNELLNTLFNSPISDCVVYRGESDSRFKLIPSLFRDGGQQEMINRIGKNFVEHRPIRISDDCNVKNQCYEYASILAFSQMSNRSGLFTPDIVSQRNLISKNSEYVISGDKEILELKEHIALAQHYGLPTRFLDWTFDPLCALYFATKEIYTDKPLPDSFAIYVMNMDMVTMLSNKRIDFVTPHYSYNQNICAQTGTLSYVNYENDSMKKKAINEILIEESKKCEFKPIEQKPVMRKFIVDYCDKTILRDILIKHGLTYDRFFPGYKGIVEGMIQKYDH